MSREPIERGPCDICNCPVHSRRTTVRRHNVCGECGERCQHEWQRRQYQGTTQTSAVPVSYGTATLPPQYDIEAIIEARVQAAVAARLGPQPDADFSKFEDGASVMISDPHIPLHNCRQFDAAISFVEQQPKGYIKRLILAGDVFDGTNLAKYLKQSRDEGHGGDFGDELAMGRGQVNALVRAVEGECWLMSGNHELGRLHRVLAETRGVPAEPLEMEHLLKFYEYDERLKFHPERKLTIGRGDTGSIDIIHGDRYNKHTAATILEKNLYRSIVQGHTHRPQTFWVKGRFGHVNGHMHDMTRVGYMPDPEWVPGFSIFEHWDNGTKVNPYFLRQAEDGSFSFNGKVYRG